MTTKQISDYIFNKEEVLNDLRIAIESRHASLIGRKEVFMGKAKFGIFGDGKEVPQLAMAKFFQNGDFRSGYYRDQTFMFAIGGLSIQEFYAQLYAHTDVKAEPSSAGRCMNGHFSTRSLNDDGSWKNLTEQKNSSSDISCTAGQMPRLVGLAYASKLYRENKELGASEVAKNFSINGNEVAFGTIGNASSAEGMFFEAINAAGVLNIPMITSIWDDGYGISVPNEYQMTKNNVSDVLKGFQKEKDTNGLEIFTVNAWDYPALVNTYRKAVELARKNHTPALIHVQEVTQPQGHSTSGSHERYKSAERLQWEDDFDCIKKMKEWVIKEGFATQEEIDRIDAESLEKVKGERKAAWDAFKLSMKVDFDDAVELMARACKSAPENNEILRLSKQLKKTINPIRKDAISVIRHTLRELRFSNVPVKSDMSSWLEKVREENYERYSSYLYSESDEAALKITPIAPIYTPNSPMVDGREIMQSNFDQMFAKDQRVFAIGEDVGKIGDVNQGFAGLQEKYSESRITDTGIRETTILGQGIGAALRGLRPIIEIQYLDYIYYALTTLSDDLACLQYRTKGGQKAPVIIRTRGHRLEGVWHSGSPIAALLNSLRGINFLVPRNMTRAAGFYNTMLKSDEPALIIECLNGYRLKEKMPENLSDVCTPLGIPEVIRIGTDITIVTYGSMCRIVMEAAEQLAKVGISMEVIDVQTLLPFDINEMIKESIKKTNRVIFADEDMPGGTTGYLMQQVIDKQKAFEYLDSQPVCIAAMPHRPAYSTDGDYFSKPNADDVFETAYAMMAEVDPESFPNLF
ncbi:alpha-ketoacid dehydrogenase subunit alpha/beta [Flammeovirga kamogawensis]|uniref:Transketolase n=1 Tax=Flammeovirga kamogawensis TaxID=373891 RepID=A0ABX8GWY3_9BACT|nr:alpha-ketoacid dehydrogenase subunit alpha/beta [Flammeovirga kamogawensis]MBB6460733.1 pyruvate/2-oxoglutarate/acetoin dehydrogenase E1 component/TPP-dependent pyruvate/acetoin dehydrogenase alpha subunit [Flammeovirga kamogawensis]QWG08086.1 transketolase [Flammeovirga kamogawensis]TRX69889.1 transketolase [Flammeovirga kamogawensis]